MRARILLCKQDRLAILERRLNKLDQEEELKIRLGSLRSDDNEERERVLVEIEKVLSEYGTDTWDLAIRQILHLGIDALLERNDRVLRLEPARSRAVTNLQNWINGNGCIARAETAYLSLNDDLIQSVTEDEGVVPWLAVLAEDVMDRLRRCFGMVRSFHTFDNGLHFDTYCAESSC